MLATKTAVVWQIIGCFAYARSYIEQKSKWEVFTCFKKNNKKKGSLHNLTLLHDFSVKVDQTMIIYAIRIKFISILLVICKELPYK